MRGSKLVNIPLHSISSERALEQPKMNGIISDGVGLTPYMEGEDVIDGVLFRITLKHGNVRGELGRHSWPTNIVMYRVVNQLAKIWET